jgi:large subunit ribosomal protein L22
MKTVKAIAKNVRGSVRKARIPAMVVEGMSVEAALPVLKYMPKRAAAHVYKVVSSARANAVNNFGIDPKNLFITEIRVDKGMSLKRFRPKSRGNASEIIKQFCHISVTLSEGVPNSALLENAEIVKEETNNKTSKKVQKTNVQKKENKVKSRAK